MTNCVQEKSSTLKPEPSSSSIGIFNSSHAMLHNVLITTTVKYVLAIKILATANMIIRKFAAVKT